MDTDNPSSPTPLEQRRNQQVDNAIRAIQDKKPLPEIDFTIHTMEDGTQVNTLERVCKGMFSFIRPAPGFFNPDRSPGIFTIRATD